jgi:carboxylesterase type B
MQHQGSVFIANALPKLQSYKQIESIFQEAYSSHSAANAVLRVYGIEPWAALPALHKSLIRFITDVAFGYSIFSAHQNLSIRSHGDETQKIDHTSVAHKRATTAQLYKIEFGNPFPGPSYEVAHHCVDLIYIFEAFHDDLEATDGRSSGYDAAISNSALTRAMQSTWINFIVGDVKDVREDMCLVFGKDRVSRMENLGSNPKWVEQRCRIDLIAAHRREASTVMERIFALAR